MMDKSPLDLRAQSTSLSSQPSRRRQRSVQNSRSSATRGSADCQKAGRDYAPKGSLRCYTWVCDQDTLEAVYVN
jgi:hypothetical protein